MTGIAVNDSKILLTDLQIKNLIDNHEVERFIKEGNFYNDIISVVEIKGKFYFVNWNKSKLNFLSNNYPKQYCSEVEYDNDKNSWKLVINEEL